jgi:hypothetical protein
MSIIFEEAGEEIVTLINQVMHETRPDLVDAGVKVAAITRTKFDKNDEEVPSLKLHGAYALATIKPIKRKARTHTPHDALIEIDNPQWKILSPQCKKALIDHEITHLVLKLGKNGEPKLDDLDRPIVGTRPDDFTLTGFLEVIKRHGNAALEYQSVTRIHAAVLEAVKQAAAEVRDVA